MQFIYEDRTPGLEHARDFNKVYSVIKLLEKNIYELSFEKYII